MSTRCQIGIYESAEQPIDKPSALLYKHSDGYPDGNNGVPALIIPFLEQFKAGRGLCDAEYLPARLIQFMCNKSDKSTRKHWPDSPYQFLSYGVCAPDNFHGDINYFYRIYPDALEVYECRFDAEPKDYKLIDTYFIE